MAADGDGTADFLDLDFIGSQHGLQHLDVKPANLFLIANHVKVGDYGLVSKLAAGNDDGNFRGLTPRYVAPEVLRGEIATRSDQYSLALVYQELLTGTFAYSGTTAAQLMMQHMVAAPNLASLPAWELRRPKSWRSAGDALERLLEIVG